jgi:hypothetical protein
MEKAIRTSIVLSFALLLSTSVAASAEDQAVTLGPWTVASSSRCDKFDSCTMSRSTNDLDVSFVRAYMVTLIAGSRSVEAKASAETKGVTIALTDRPLNERMRTANVLEVMGEGATLRVPLDGSIAALARLETCFEKNSRQSSDTNPFVAPNRKP